MCVLLAASVLLPGVAVADDNKPADAPAEKPAPKPPKLKFIDVDIENKVVSIEGNICLNEGPLELVATLIAGKEHEAICTVKARPQHIHLAMLMIGLKAGQPSEWKYVDDKIVKRDAQGDRVHVSIAYEVDGEQVEKPIGRFIRHMKTKQVMDSSVFIFAGSHVVQPKKGEPYYAADATGDIITLVSFNEEVLAWPTAASKSNDALKWEANPKTLPRIGTPIRLKLRPAPHKDENADTDADADKPPATQN